MTPFLIAAGLLVVATLLMLLRPWRRDRLGTPANTSARDINAALCRDQLAELDRDLAAGTLAAVDHAQARDELQRRLLDDAGGRATPASVPASASARRTPWFIALAVPLLAGSLYAVLGRPAALDERARQGATQADVEKMVESLATRLAAQPDPKGFAMLARSYRVMGRMQDAQSAFARVGPELERDPGLLAEYADTLAANAQGNLEGKPLELVAKALAIEPNHPMSLALAATAALNRNDLGLATTYWERMLPQLPPDSDDAKWVANQLTEIRAKTGQRAPNDSSAPGAVEPAKAGAAATPTPATDQAAIRGRVSLDPALAAEVRPDDTVFVFARAANGPRMPLAVQRARAADLPLAFRLDDSTAMSPELRLSSAAEVRIEARISRSGSATPGPGDLIGTGPVVKPGASGLALVIDKRRP
jgi:cytochrome c-type biogenesis protein CcmH